MSARQPSLHAIFTLPFIVSALAAPLLAQSYDLSWHTIDGGGPGVPGFSSGGAYRLGGTIGQPDAGSFTAPMSGGSYSLTGGFWPAAGQQCLLPGDMNLDGLRDGADVQLFVNCLVGVSGSNCGCADFDGGGTVSSADLAPFVAALLAP